MRPFIIAIAGGSGSGKTTFGKALSLALGEEQCQILSQDNYYRDQSEHFDYDGGRVNFDHPDAIEFSLLAAHLKALKEGQTIEMPQYDFAAHARSQQYNEIKPLAFIIVDGILILHSKECQSALDYKIYVETPDKIRFERRLKRDTTERGRDEKGVREQFEKQVRPMHEEFVAPSKEKANLVVSGLEDYGPIISQLSQEWRDQLIKT